MNKLGTRAYVTNYDGTVTVVDTTTKQPLATIATGGPKYQPAGVVIDANTNKLVQNIAIDPAGESGAHYVALSADGTRIYVTDLNDDNVRVLSLTRGNTAPLSTTPSTVGTPNVYTGAVSGLVNIKDPDGDPITSVTTGTVNVGGNTPYTYQVTSAPTYGSVVLDPNTGNYTRCGTTHSLGRPTAVRPSRGARCKWICMSTRTSCTE